MATQTLPDRMRQMRRDFEEQVPDDVLEVVHGATEDLKESGIAERARSKGDPAPAFELENTKGEMVRSEKLLEQGPLVVNFYRGVW